MKKFIDTDEQIILIYGLASEKLKILQNEAEKKNFRIIEVSHEHTFCRVEDLIFEDYSHCIVEDASPIDIEFLLFVNIIKDDLYRFIQILKDRGLYFPNKAILTPTSKEWKLRRLLAENKEEHIVMTMFSNLRRAMRKANAIKEQNRHDDELIEIMEDAKHYLNPREFDFDEMKYIHNRLANKVNEIEGF